MLKEAQSAHFMKEVSTPLGRLTLVCSERAIRAILCHRDSFDSLGFAARPKRVTRHSLLDETERQLKEYMRGERQRFDLPLDPRGTPFQKSAWKILTQIPYGQTLSYQEQARRLGNSNKARAVGAANGKNPILILIPCHRVVGKSGDLTGFAGGLELKRRLLDLEAKGD